MTLSLEQFLGVRRWALWARAGWLRFGLGVDLDFSVRASMSSRIRPGRRGSIRIGSQTQIAFDALIFSYDPVEGWDRPVSVGARCFIGAASVILPGVTIGDECIVGAGSVVSEDVPSRCVVAGNPARILKRGIEVGPFGRYRWADAAIPVAIEQAYGASGP
jgi:acetyltransferase-like isoleucine patch superfamily enzyme